MNDTIKIVSIISVAVCFLLSPLLFPGNPEISKNLMYALFAVVGIPTVANGINILRGK
jgi:uncharacterized membrane protein